ncbi:hypothetical protein BG004_007752 [Podila humilis]|nr:hypothetical protein BG004_007752 [Podila humilis]
MKDAPSPAPSTQAPSPSQTENTAPVAINNKDVESEYEAKQPSEVEVPMSEWIRVPTKAPGITLRVAARHIVGIQGCPICEGPTLRTLRTDKYLLFSVHHQAEADKIAAYRIISAFDEDASDNPMTDSIITMRTVHIAKLPTKIRNEEVQGSVSIYGLVDNVKSNTVASGRSRYFQVIFESAEAVKELNKNSATVVMVGKHMGRLSQIAGERVKWHSEHQADLSSYAHVYFANAEDKEWAETAHIDLGEGKTTWSATDDAKSCCYHCGKDDGHRSTECDTHSAERKNAAFHFYATRGFKGPKPRSDATPARRSSPGLPYSNITKGSHHDDFPSLPATQRSGNIPEHPKQLVTLAPTSGELDLRAEFEKFKRETDMRMRDMSAALSALQKTIQDKLTLHKDIFNEMKQKMAEETRQLSIDIAAAMKTVNSTGKLYS